MDNFTREFLDNILNSIADPVFVKDEAHRWILLNDAFCEFLGHKRSELINKSDYDFFSKSEADVFWEIDELVFQSESENLNEEFFTDSNGDVFTIETRKNIIKDKYGKKFLVGVIRNISEKKELIKNLQQSNILLENFAYIASHDLKAPLNTISSHAKILSKSSKEKLNDSENKSLQFIQKSSDGLGFMVRSLLTFSKAKTQKLLLKEQNIEELLNDILKELESEFKRTSYKITTDEMPNSLIADGLRLKQLFQNLITNALKFKSPNRHLELHIGFEDHDDHVHFSVKDNGIGIPAVDRDRVFSLFERLNSSTKNGSGIGLSICELIAIQHGGRIWVDTNKDIGSTFHFTISKTLAPKNVLDVKEVETNKNSSL